MQEQIRKAMKAQAVEDTKKEGKTKEGKTKEGKTKEGKTKEGKTKEGKTKEGKTTIYRFEPIDDVSKEIRDFAARMRKMAEG
jgi:hypothetical protein